MSTIFKALQKNSQKQETHNETISVIRESKSKKFPFIPAAIIIIFFAGIIILGVRLYENTLLNNEAISTAEEHYTMRPAETVPQRPRPNITAMQTQPLERVREPSAQEAVPHEEVREESGVKPSPPPSVPEEEKAPQETTGDILIPEEVHPESTSSVDLSAYELQGVAGDEHGYIAIINDNIVGEGDYVDDAKIISIRSDHVELEINSERFRIFQ